MPNRTKTMSDTLAGRIKFLRIKHGHTQKELSEHLYKSESAVRMWELGKSEPDIDTIVKMAIYFGVSVDHLLGFDDKKYEELSEPDKVVHDVANRFYNEETDEYSATEKTLIEYFRKLDESERFKVIQYTMNLSSEAEKKPSAKAT